MATFARQGFNAAGYAAFRPTYPRQLFEYVFNWHEKVPGARFELAVDLGCGTGQATSELTRFRQVIGVDPSTGLVDQANAVKADKSDELRNVEFVHGNAEVLPMLEDGSVDLLVAAQAAHWFDWEKGWTEWARILRKRGTLAFWIYSEFRLPAYPEATSLIEAYAKGPDYVGPYWQQPGRSILDNHLLDVSDAPSSSFSDFERSYFAGPYHPDLPNNRPVILRKTMVWRDFYSYLQTWSSLHTWREQHPDDALHPERDISTQFYHALREKAGLPKDTAVTEDGQGENDGAGAEKLELEWPIALLMARRL